MTQHSLIGASSMSRLIACPGSFRLSQQVGGTGLTTIYAATGTVAHALAEEAMTKGYNPSQEIGTVVTVDGHDVEVTQEMVDAVSIYIDLVSSWRGAADWHALETRVCLDPYWGPDEKLPVSAFGTADALAYFEDRQHLDVGDYKNGAGVFVDVIDNPQLLYYAAGALLEVPGPVRTVDLVVVQPNVRGQEKVRRYSLTALDVKMWVREVLKPTIAAVMQPSAPLAAGKHCRFCPARIGCPARNALRQEAARRDFGPNNAKLVTFTPAQLAEALNELVILDDHAKAIREHAMDRVTNGKEIIPGWGVQPTRPVRSWDKANVIDLCDAIFAETGEPQATVRGALMAPAPLKTPAQMEKSIHHTWWDAIKGLVVSKPSGVKLVPESADPTGEKSTRNSPQDDFA
jgi:hypothetical protein